MEYIGDPNDEEVIKSYEEVKESYQQVISLANQYYDMVIVDTDKSIGEENIEKILAKTDIIVAMTSQKAKQIQKIQELIDKREILKDENTILTLGRYMDETKYNAKNITRKETREVLKDINLTIKNGKQEINLLRKKDIVNTIPYNNLFFEASQEGKVIDIFFDFLKIKEKDINNKYKDELSRLYSTVQNKVQMLQMNRRI